MHIRHYLAALNYVNRKRLARGLPSLDRLPTGEPVNPRDCVIARAIPGSIVFDKTIRLDYRRMSPLPRGVSKFVNSFDAECIVDAARSQQWPNHGRDPGELVEGGIDDDKGCLVSA